MAFPTNNCDPRLIQVDEANGSTLTRASIRAFTKQDFEDQALKEVGMDRIIAQTKEARMAGVRERSLTDLLLSRHVALKTSNGGGSQSVIAPFVLVPRQNVINANYFQVEAGVADADAGGTDADGLDIPASAWMITVNVGSSPWVASPSNPLKNLHKFFLKGGYLVVEYKDGAGVAQSPVFKIIKAVETAGSNGAKADVTLEPNWTAAGFAGLAGAAQAVYQPTAGTVSLMQNSVSDFESYGEQTPALNNLTLIEYWQQTYRWAFSYNEEYVKALESPLTSEYFKKFRSLPLAKQRKQQEMWLENQLYNTFFFGDRINEKQTVETYQQLPVVVDPADSNYQIEFKANTLGVRTQINACGRVYDKQGNALDLDNIFEMCYNLKRNRETTSGTIDRIDFMTDRLTKGMIRDIMTKYYKAKYSIDTTLYYQPNQKLTFNGATVFEFDLYDLPDQGVQMAIFTDAYFDDRLAQFAVAQKSRGRCLWGIDWSDVSINVVKTNSAKRTTNVADELYRYVITPNIKQTMLNSKTIEVRVGDANRHAIYENFSDACPAVTVVGCDLN